MSRRAVSDFLLGSGECAETDARQRAIGREDVDTPVCAVEEAFMDFYAREIFPKLASLRDERRPAA